MTICVKFFAILRDRAGLSEFILTLEDGASVRRAIEKVAEKFEGVQSLLKPGTVAFAVNRAYVSPETELHEGDELALIPPVSGGSAETSETRNDAISERAKVTPVKVIPIALDYATPGRGDDVWGIHVEADEKIKQGKPPRHIVSFFSRREDALAYYALALPRLTDEVLGTDRCHVCGKSDGLRLRVTVMWRAEMRPTSFQYSRTGRILRDVITYHVVCPSCQHRWSVRLEILRWIRWLHDYYGTGFGVVFVGFVVALVGNAGLVANVFGGTTALMVLGAPLVLISGSFAASKSAPWRLRRLIHKTTACLGIRSGA